MSEQQIIDQVRENLANLGYPVDSSSLEGQARDEGVDFVVMASGRPIVGVEIKLLPSAFLPSARRQLELYLRRSRCRYGILSNGKETHYYLRLASDDVIELPRLPKWGDILRPEKSSLKTLETSISTLFRIAEIVRRDSLSRPSELLKLILCKYVDEIDPDPYPEFFVQAPLSDSDGSDWAGATKVVVSSLFEKVKFLYPSLFSVDEKIELDANALARIVGELQSYSIKRAPPSLRRFLAEATGGFSYKSWGGYQTPTSLTDFLVRMVEPGPSEAVLDPACGTGGLLLSCLDYVKETYPSISTEEYTTHQLFGIDISLEAVSLARVNMILQGDGHSNILHADSLAKLSQRFQFRPILDRGGFDIVLLDPPLGAQSHVTEGFVLGTGRSRQDTAILLLERAIQLTKPGGRIGALVDDNLLFSENMNVAREFLRRNAIVKAIVSLPPGILRPFTSAKVSAIILEKKKESFDSPYNIFMAHVNAERELAAVVDQYHNARFLTGPDTFTMASAQLDNRWNVEFHQLAPPPIGQPLSTFASIRRGKSIPSTEYITEGSDGLPYIRISDLVKGTVTRHSVRYVPTRAASALARTKTNDVLLSLTGTIGKTALVPKELDGAAVSSQLAIIRPNEKAAVAGFLAKVLASKKVREQIKRFTTGAIIEHISVEDLRKLLVSLPPIEEQKSTLASIQELESSSRDLSDSQRQLQERIERLLEDE